MYIFFILSVRLQDDIVTVAKHLSTCGQSKFYLREVCAVGVTQLVEQYCSADVSRDHVISLLGIDGGWEGCTPERLYTMLHLNKLYGKVFCANELMVAIRVFNINFMFAQDKWFKNSDEDTLELQAHFKPSQLSQNDHSSSGWFGFVIERINFY